MTKINYKNYISVVAATVLLTACGGGGGSSTTTTPTTTTTGTMVDGYVSGASVYYNGEVVGNTDANGKFSVNNIPEGAVLSFKGGTDISTGEVFEGVLKAPAGADGEDIVATPITTIVSSLIEKGKSEDEAKQITAKSFNVSIDSIESDPVETLKSGTAEQKAEAAKVIKKALVIQKAAETFATVAGASDEAFDAVMDTIADTIETSDSENSLDTIMQNTASIASKMAIKLATDETETAKITAIADSAKSVVDTINSIDETKLAQAVDTTQALENTSKAIEIITEAVERKAEVISEATDTATIEAAKVEAQKVTKTISVLGGLDGVQATLEKELTLKGKGSTVDASSFGEAFINDTFVETASTTFDTLEASGLSEDMIQNVGVKIAESTVENIDLTTVVNEVVQEAVSNGEITEEESASVNVTAVVDAVESSKTVLDEAVNSASEVAVTEGEVTTKEPTDEEPAVEEPTDEEPAVEEPTDEEPAVEEPTDEEPVTQQHSGSGSTANDTASVSVKLDLDNVNVDTANANIAASAPSTLDISISENGKAVTVELADGVEGSVVAELVGVDAVPTEYRDVESTYYVKITKDIYIKITVTYTGTPDLSSKFTVQGITISDDTVTVGNGGSVTNGTFTDINRTKLEGNGYDDIQSQLGNLFNVNITLSDTASLNNALKKEVTLGVLVKDKTQTDASGRFVMVAIPALMSNINNNLKIEVESGSEMTMIGRQSSGDVFTATKTNVTANIAEGTASKGSKTWTINTANAINEFANNAQVGTLIKDTIVSTATNTGKYDIYVVLSNTAFGLDEDDISFTNDKEDINLYTITGINTSSSIGGMINNLFGTQTTVKGFTGVLNITE